MGVNPIIRKTLNPDVRGVRGGTLYPTPDIKGVEGGVLLGDGIMCPNTDLPPYSINIC